MKPDGTGKRRLVERPGRVTIGVEVGEERAEARAGTVTLARCSVRRSAPPAAPPVGLGVTLTAGGEFSGSGTSGTVAHGAAWRLLSGLAIDGDREVKIGEGDEIPPPPGFDLVVA
jgi:hypothetical protein